MDASGDGSHHPERIADVLVLVSGESWEKRGWGCAPCPLDPVILDDHVLVPRSWSRRPLSVTTLMEISALG